MDWESHLEEKLNNKMILTTKNEVKVPHVNQKPHPGRRVFVQTPLSHSSLNLQ